MRSRLTRLYPELGEPLQVTSAGIRIALAALLPLLFCMAIGRETAGVIAAVGGLYVGLQSPQSRVTRFTFLIQLNALICLTLSFFLGALTHHSPFHGTLLLFIVAFLGAEAGVLGDRAAKLGNACVLTFGLALILAAHSIDVASSSIAYLIGGIVASLVFLLPKSLDRHFLPPGLLSEELPPTNAARAKLQLRIRQRLLLASVFRRISRDPETLEHALRLALVVSLTYAVLLLTKLPESHWVLITILTILRPNMEETREKFRQRVLGTVIGGLVAILLAPVTSSHAVALILLFPLAILGFSSYALNYVLYVTFLTPWVIILIGLDQPGNTKLALFRIMNTILGAVIAVTAAWLLRFAHVQKLRTSRSKESLSSGA